MTVRKLLIAMAIAVMALGSSPASAATGRQDFILVTSGSTEGPTGRVAAVGTVNATGTAQRLSFTVSPTGEVREDTRYTFPSGSVVNSFVGRPETFTFDPRTCITRLSIGGTYTIHSGTGVFEGASGGGTITSDIRQIQTRTAQGCTGPTYEVTVVKFTGTIDLPD